MTGGPPPEAGWEQPDPEALEADAALLDALAAGELPAGADPVAGMLAALRAELDQPPSAPARPAAGRPRPRRRARRILLAAGAASAVALGGVAAAAVVAPPGSLLYPLHEFLTGAPTPTQTTIQDLLAAAATELRQGHLRAAAADLDRARALLDRVGSSNEQARLSRQVARLSAQVAHAHHGRPPASPTPTPAPMPTPSQSVAPTPTATPAVSHPASGYGNPHSSASPTGNPHSSANPTGNPHSSAPPAGSPQPAGPPSGRARSPSPHGHGHQ